ncbi:Mu transposase C-terminal domain-containing protein [Pseudomonas yamanorum]|uniref:Mu transposase C-terminal domain-containing protein n=1 Tax=Pseudomonas yamanorum TaxID=515393 RepID=UPI002ED0F583|nr:Mu transposase C-terminal domain-containing protein [Pseudomonas yamanorum]
MRTVKISSGETILCHGEIAEINACLSHDKIHITYLKTQKQAVITPDDISMVINYELLEREKETPKTDLSLFSDSQLSEAQRRFDILSAHLADEHSKQMSVIAISQELGLSISRTYKLISRYEKNSDLCSLINDSRGRKLGTSRLPADLELIIQTTIKNSKGPSSTIANIYRSVCAMCANANLKPPSLKAVATRVHRQPSKERSVQVYGAKKACQDNSIRPRRFTTHAALDLVQLDHCKVDCEVVDDVHRKVIARPWLTLAIDVHSRSVLGFYLTLDHPSALSNAMCMIHSVLPKNKWLKKLNMHDVEYPFYGVPRRIHVDNGKDFRSAAFISGCSQNNIKLTWRPPATPHHGAHIERLIGTFMVRVRGLPGATLSSVYDKKKHSNIATPAMTLSELRVWITEQIGIYHKETHSSLGCSPLYYWEQCFRSKEGYLTSPDLIVDSRKFLLDFLPFKRATLQRAGVRVNGIDYYSPALTAFSIKTKCVIRYSPSSLALIWVKPEGSSDYIECAYSDMRLPDISKAEYIQAKKELTKSNHERINAQDVFAAIERNAKLVTTAIQTTKKFRLSMERRKHRPEFPFETSKNTKNSGFVDYSVPPKIYDVE